jgi:hypothetical protein
LYAIKYGVEPAFRPADITGLRWGWGQGRMHALTLSENHKNAICIK